MFKKVAVLETLIKVLEKTCEEFQNLKKSGSLRLFLKMKFLGGIC